MSSESILGQGTFGSVKRVKGNPPVAVKRMFKREDPKFDQIFARETEALQRFDHPNIVKFLESSRTEKDGMITYEIWMEYCERNSLRKVLETPTIVYGMKAVFVWAEQLFGALCYLLDQELVHRDIKPENIFVTKEFHLKLGDFGCVREVNTVGPITFAGTPQYMSPEALSQGKKPVNLSKRDIYSTSLVLWELIERRRMFLEYAHPEGFKFTELYEDLKSGSCVLDLAECDHEVILLIYMCVEPDQHRRPDTLQVYQALQTMNQTYTDSFMVKIREDEERLLKPIGFDGQKAEVGIDEYVGDFEKRESPDVKKERIRRFMRQLAKLSNRANSTDVFLEDFERTWPIDSMDVQLKRLYLDPQIRAQIVREKKKFFDSYTFLIDEQPRFACFESLNESFLELLIDKEIPEKTIKTLILHLREQSGFVEGIFPRWHQKVTDFLKGNMWRMSAAEHDDWVKEHDTWVERSLLYKDLSDMAPSLKLYSNPPKSDTLWVLLSEKEQLWGKMKIGSEVQRLAQNKLNSFIPTYAHFVADNGDILEPVYNLDLNPFPYLCHKHLYKRLRQEVEAEKMEASFPGRPLNANFFSWLPFKEAYSENDDFPNISYVFQLSIGPLDSKYIIYSKLRRDELIEYHDTHAWLSLRLDSDLDLPRVQTSKGPTYFYFFMTQAYGNYPIVVFDLPQEEKQEILCLDVERSRLFKGKVSLNEILLDDYYKIKIDDLLEILKFDQQLKNFEETAKHPSYCARFSTGMDSGFDGERSIYDERSAPVHQELKVNALKNENCDQINKDHNFSGWHLFNRRYFNKKGYTKTNEEDVEGGKVNHAGSDIDHARRAFSFKSFAQSSTKVDRDESVPANPSSLRSISSLKKNETLLQANNYENSYHKIQPQSDGYSLYSFNYAYVCDQSVTNTIESNYTLPTSRPPPIPARFRKKRSRFYSVSFSFFRTLFTQWGH